jgi:hypothetical protein
MEIFLSAIFIMLQKNAKMALLNPCMKLEFCLAKSILLKQYENDNKKKFPIHVPGSAKSRIYAGKRTKRGFSKTALTGIEKLFLF